MHDIHGMEGESCRAGLKFQISARPESETAAGSRLLRAPRPHGRGDTFSRLSGCVCLGRSGLSVRVVCYRFVWSVCRFVWSQVGERHH